MNLKEHNKKPLRVLNLFDGIGGFALAAEWMGRDNVASCEIDPFCRNTAHYEDLISGGLFPDTAIDAKSFMEEYFNIEL